MGLEYSVLVGGFVITFSLLVFSSLSLYLMVVSEISKVPIIEVYAEASVDRAINVSRIMIVIYHSRGDPTEVKTLVLETDHGYLTVAFPPPGGDTLEIITLGLKDNKVILPGSTSYLFAQIIGVPFTEGTQYKGLIFHSKGIIDFSFAVLAHLNQTT